MTTSTHSARCTGLLWDKGRFTTFDGPDGAAAASFLDINDRGQVVGSYFDGDPTAPPTDPEAIDGFLLSNGDYTTFDAPGAGATFPFGINNRGQIVVSTTSGGASRRPRASCCARAPTAPFIPYRPARPHRCTRNPAGHRHQRRRRHRRPRRQPQCQPDSQPSPMLDADDDDVGRVTADRPRPASSGKGDQHGFGRGHERSWWVDAQASSALSLQRRSWRLWPGFRHRAPLPPPSLRFCWTEIATPRSRLQSPACELFPTGIDDRGQIVGEYIVDASKESAFVRDKRGRFTTIDVPGAQGTEPHRSNNRGQIVGLYSDDTPIVNNSARPRGFLLDRGELTALDVPGAVLTSPNGINDGGQVVGEYTRRGGMVHGFLWDKGRLMTFDGPDGTGASFYDINDRGQILGVPTAIPSDPGTLPRLCAGGGRSTRHSTPRGPADVPLGINNRGQIVGYSASDPAFTDARRIFAAQGRQGPLHPDRLPGRAQNPGGRHQRPRPDRGRLREPRCRAGSPARARCGCQERMMMSGSEG